MQHYGWITCRSAGGVQTYTVFQRYTSQSERIVFTQVVLRGERQLTHIIEALDIIWGDAQFFELLTIELRVHTMMHGVLQAFQLELTQLLHRHRFDFRIKIVTVFHSYD